MGCLIQKCARLRNADLIDSNGAQEHMQGFAKQGSNPFFTPEIVEFMGCLIQKCARLRNAAQADTYRCCIAMLQQLSTAIYHAQRLAHSHTIYIATVPSLHLQRDVRSRFNIRPPLRGFKIPRLPAPLSSPNAMNASILT